MRLHGKENYVSDDYQRLSRPENREIVLNYQGGPNIITGILKSRKRRQKSRVRGKCEHGRKAEVTFLSFKIKEGVSRC